MSGFVASENNGCSIDAMSSFGTASAISSTKKSKFGCRSGSRLIRRNFDLSGTILFDLSGTVVDGKAV